jgi:hypothetical protein
MDLKFKGARDYLHGTDIYDGTMQVLQRIAPEFAHGRLRMVIHEFAHRQCDLVCTTGAVPCPRPDDARIEFWLSGGVSAWLTETSRPVTRRQPYPEDEIVAVSKIDGQTIQACGVPPFSPIEMIVTLTKELHLALRGRNKRWAFTRLELERPLAAGDPVGLRIELLQSLGNRLTRCAVRSAGEPLGHIFFSAVGS